MIGAEVRGLVGLLIALGAAGCAGPLATTFSSTSLGTAADGTLRHPASLPFEGEGYAVPMPWRTRHANYGTEALVDLVARVSRNVERDAPGGVASIGDLSRRRGGGSAQHKSHQDGRDVDVFFYAADTAGRPMRLNEAMLHFSSDGRALRWSPPQGVRAPARPVPPYRFDARRNWAFVRGLLTDPEAEVQWIFVQRNLGAALLREAAAEGDDPALLARAAFILHQPSDSEPHDDHMHVRLYCGLSERSFGCVDKGPVRWWKKMWKYMEAPFARAPADPVGGDRLAAFGRLIREEPPPAPAAGKLTS